MGLITLLFVFCYAHHQHASSIQVFCCWCRYWPAESLVSIYLKPFCFPNIPLCPVFVPYLNLCQLYLQPVLPPLSLNLLFPTTFYALPSTPGLRPVPYSSQCSSEPLVLCLGVSWGVSWAFLAFTCTPNSDSQLLSIPHGLHFSLLASKQICDLTPCLHLWMQPVLLGPSQTALTIVIHWAQSRLSSVRMPADRLCPVASIGTGFLSLSLFHSLSCKCSSEFMH